MKAKTSKPAAGHFSVSDWDVDSPVPCSLSSTQYVSPPTSRYCLEAASVWRIAHHLCRIAATQCLPQGRWITYIRIVSGSHEVALFRNQAALGSANHDNCYYVHVGPAGFYLRRMIGGATSYTWPTYEWTSPDGQWHHYRVDWWNGTLADGTPCLCVEVFKEITGEWVLQGERMTDTTNQWKDSEINRVGFRINAGYGDGAYFDDSEIWAPV